MSIAISKTRETLRNALTNFAKQAEVAKSRLQLVITTYDEKERMPAYRVLVDTNPFPINGHHPDGSVNDHVTFAQVSGKKIDFFNLEGMATPFLQDALLRFQNETGVPAHYLSVVVMTNDTEETPLAFQLFKETPANPLYRTETYLDANNQPQEKQVRNDGKKEFVRHLKLEADIFGIPEDVLEPQP